MKGPAFSKKTVLILSTVATLSLATCIALFVFGDEWDTEPSSGADSYSVSAIGHRAFTDLLKELEVPVLASRHASGRRAGPEDLLVIAEPDLKGEDPARIRALKAMLDHEGPVLLVLPKWTGTPDPKHPGWIQSARSNEEEAHAVLRAAAGPTASLRRVKSAVWESKRFDVTPTLPPPTQLIRAPKGSQTWVGSGDESLVSILASDDGSRQMAVLSDPDLISSHGLHRGDNAILVARLVDALRPEGGVVIVDETLHGKEIEPSLWRALLSWPLVLVLLALGLTTVLWVWSGFKRFGLTVPVAPPIDPGKRFLIEHTASILEDGGHATYALGRFLATTSLAVARATHAPPSLSEEGVKEWVSRVAKTRRVSTRFEDLEAVVAEATSAGERTRNDRAVIDAAMRIHEWRRELTDGPGGDS